MEGEHQKLEFRVRELETLEQELRTSLEELKAKKQQVDLRVKTLEGSLVKSERLRTDLSTQLSKSRLLVSGVEERLTVDASKLCRVISGDALLEIDIAVVSASSGALVADRLVHCLRNSCGQTVLQTSIASGASEDFVIRCVLNAKSVVIVILSKGAMTDAGCLFALLSADEASKRVLLVHDAESCRFPSYDQMPKNSHGRVSVSFDSKAIVYVRMYERSVFATVRQRLQGLLKLGPKSGAAVQTEEVQQADNRDPFNGAPVHLQQLRKVHRLFYSHRQLSGRYAVHRTHEALREDYRGFLDVEAGDLELHNLVQLVKRTHTFIAYISEGYFESQYCVLELIVAVRHNLKLVFIRDYMCCQEPELGDVSNFYVTLQQVWNAHREDANVFAAHSLDVMHERVQQIVHARWESSIVYHPELFHEYLRKVHQQLGPSDCALEFIEGNGDALDLRDTTGVPVSLSELGSIIFEQEYEGDVSTGKGNPWSRVATVAVASLVADVYAFLKFTSQLSKVRVLDMKQLNLSDSGTSLVASALSDLQTLEVLNLSDNHIGDGGDSPQCEPSELLTSSES
ncbi:hypothetical protein CYMTET_16889 [Cymbomonas tetramitiformis]|uniref:TIR domain-containing protein n=1 Tax=Cymbomonas tetramitiformis TaxID=36881 RepID=A0AAE0GBA9_9CHLO|nr:hypothetical protein CYMTET_16889 [Cymbomonas tetramitiformis]|eukprot:gene23483-28433_t